MGPLGAPDRRDPPRELGPEPQLWRAVFETGAGFLGGVLADIAGGVQSMGELDFARLCRRRGLPPPSRQVRRIVRGGRASLDVYWDAFHVVVEIDGAQHLLPGIAVSDSLRQNDLTIQHDAVLRIPCSG